MSLLLRFRDPGAVFPIITWESLTPAACSGDGFGNGLARTVVTIIPTSGTATRTLTRTTQTFAGKVVVIEDDSATSASPDSTTTYVAGQPVTRVLSGATFVESWTYDALGREIRHTDPRGASTATSYNPVGQAVTVTDAAGQTTTYTYYPATDPAAGRVASVTNPKNKAVSYGYDNLGHVTSVSGDAAYPVIYTYDSYGARETMTTRRSENQTSTTTWIHDPATGLLAKKIYQGQTADTPAWLYTYFADGRIETRTSRRGVVTTCDYNGFGDLVSVAYSGDNNLTPHVTYAAFDRLGRPGSVTTGSDTATLAYDPYTGAESITYGDGDSSLPGLAVMARDADTAGRPTGFNVTQGTSTIHHNTLSYDPVLGHLSGVASDSGSTALSYYPGSSILRQAVTTVGANVVRRETRVLDPAGRIIGMHTSAGPDNSLTTLTATGYVVDELGRRTSARREDGSTWTYGYNDRSEVTAGSKRLAGMTITEFAAGQKFNYSYDDIGNRLTAFSGGNDTGADQRETSYTTNALNQYYSIQNPRSLDVIVRSPAATIGVTSAGNDVVLDNQATYSYHRAEITSWDDVAQWVPVAVTSGGQALSQGHLWLPPANVSPFFDDDGNLLNDGRWSYAWDGENRLVSMHRSSAVGPNLLLEFRYDHRGRRIAKKVTDLADNNNVLSNLRFVYDGWNLVAEFEVTEGNLSLVRSYTWGPDLSNTLQGAGGVGGLLAARSGTADFYPCFDGNGNVIAWSDSQRQVRRRFDFDPFGNVTTTENTATLMPDIPLGFSTKYTDTETGLVYYIGRYYIPPLGRWASMDPIEEEGGVNLYGFVGNDGVCSVDCFGLEAYVLLYAAHDNEGSGVFKTWADWMANKIRNKEKTDFDTDFRCFDPSVDTINYIRVDSEDDLEKLKTIKNVRYIGSFGDGRDDTFWYLNTRGGSTAIASEGTPMKSNKSDLVTLEQFSSMINWADACNSCCTAGLAIELYHCGTDIGTNPIREKLDNELNHRSALTDGFGPIPCPRTDIFVGGFSSGVSNGIGLPRSQVGFRGWPRPKEESKKRVLNPNCRPRPECAP